MTLAYSVLKFLLRDNIVQTKYPLSNFSENNITQLSSQFSRQQQHGSNEVVYF